MNEIDRALARHLAAEPASRGELLTWFEELYIAAETQGGVVPWADGVPNPQLVAWSSQHRVTGDGHRALVVGCGLGDDAEFLAGLGFSVVAFDVAPTAVRRCRERFASTTVDYAVADLTEPPAWWDRSFDFVFEANTLQALPLGAFRERAIGQLSSFVASGGTLMVVARGRDEHDPMGQVPWPLTQSEIMGCAGLRLELTSFEDIYDDETPPVRRFVATFEDPGATAASHTDS